MDYQEQINELKAKAQAEIDNIMSKLKDDLHLVDVIYKSKKHYILEDYSNGVGYQAYYVTSSNKIDHTSVFASDKDFMKGYTTGIVNNSIYPTETMAREAASLKQFNDDLLYFKYMYDRDYTPDDYWSDTLIPKYYVYCDMPNAFYSVGTAYRGGYNTVYFSSYDIAEKCADFLNKKYKLGDYADGEA